MMAVERCDDWERNRSTSTITTSGSIRTTRITILLDVMEDFTRVMTVERIGTSNKICPSRSSTTSPQITRNLSITFMVAHKTTSALVALPVHAVRRELLMLTGL